MLFEYGLGNVKGDLEFCCRNYLEICTMPRSEEAEWWANAVYEAIQEVPRGKVTSYGHIARLLGERMDAII